MGSGYHDELGNVISGPVIGGAEKTYFFHTARELIPNPEISDAQIEKLAQALADKAEATARIERLHQRRRDWKLLIIGLIAGAVVSIPIGIWINIIT